jgi:hypothetical protein
MVKAFCEDCQSPQDVVVTDQPVGETGTARRWRFQPHPAHTDTLKNGVEVIARCKGSGKLV